MGSLRIQFVGRLLLGVIGALPAATLQAGVIEVIASTGDPSPTGNGTLSLFNGPTLSATGQAAFISQLAGTAGGTSDNLALYRKDPGGLTQIVRMGSSTVNGLTVTGFFPASSWIDAHGTVVSIVGAGPAPVQFHNAIGTGGALTPMIVPGSASPSGNNMLLGSQFATFNDAGDAVYQAIYTGGNTEIGLYSRTADGTITTRLLKNAIAPRGGVITNVGRGTINESGQVATHAGVDPGTGEVSTVLRIDGTTVHELARQGDLTEDGTTTLGGLYSGAAPLNDGGQVAFVANYTQPSVNRRGVFVADDAGLRMVAPGLLPGFTSAVDDSRVLGISSSGSVGIWAEASAGVDPLSGMYVADATGPTLVALEDTLIPSGGKYFRRFFTDALAYSDNGHLAFLAELSNTVNGPVSGRGLFFYDPGSGLAEVAKTGDELMGSTIKTGGVLFYGSIGSVSLQAPDTSLSGLNKLGQAGFGFALDDGNAGVAIWSAATEFAAGDFDEDGEVGADDLDAWSLGFGASGEAAHGDGDADGDGDSDGADFLVWQRQFTVGASVGAWQTVPEPAAMLIAAASGLGLLGRRRSR